MRRIVGGAVCCLSMVLLGCGGGSSSPSGTGPKPSGGSPKSSGKPAYEGTAEAFVKECVANSASADSKYEGKIVVLQRKIENVEKLALDETRSVQLEGIPKKENELIGKIADCQFAEGSAHFAKAKAAMKGDSVKIKGKYVLSFPVGPRLQGCEFVEGK